MSQDSYGTYRQLFLPFEMMAPMLSFGLTSTIFFFYPRFESPKRILHVGLALVVCTCLVFQLLLSAGLNGLIGNFFNSEFIKENVSLLGVFALLSLSNTFIYTYFILQGKVAKSLAVNFCVNFLYVTTLFLISSSALTLINAVYLRVLAYGCIFIVMLIISEAWKNDYDSVPLFLADCKAVAKHSFPVALSLTIGVLSYQVDKFLVSFLTTPDQYAIYINGAFEIPLITVVTSSIAGATFGHFSTFCKEGRYSEAVSLFGRVCHISALILFPSFFFLLFFADYVIHALFGNLYLDSAVIFRIYLCLLPIRIVQYGNVLIALDKAKLLLVRSIIELVLGVTIASIAYFALGVSGIALGMVLSVLFWTVPFNLWEIAKGLNTHILHLVPWKMLLKSAALSGFSGLIVFIVMTSRMSCNPFTNITIALMMFGVVYTLGLVLFKVIAFKVKGGLRIIIS